MDDVEIFKYQGHHFVCSGERLPSGLFQAVVRSKRPPNDLVQILVMGAGHYATGQHALARAKELAEEWARNGSSTMCVRP